MSWTSLLRNPEGIASLYEGVPPNLVGVHLHEVALQEDGPTLRLRLDLPRYPDRPPRKWTAQGFNTVQLELSLSGLETVTLEGFGTHIAADVSLGGEGDGKGILVNVISSGTRIRAVAATAFVSKLSAYVNEV
ncbi:Imm50 family immunity protein [Streptomyces sp. NPDC053069]|uniref:Imm50 family immunity protein n=1 Tax=Streptomyces sp. NPDC053069 TaxID=3365695 RepID=UPI0037D342C1